MMMDGLVTSIRPFRQTEILARMAVRARHAINTNIAIVNRGLG